MRIATIINYCSIDQRFIDRCIEQVREFSTQIIVPVSSHLYNGKLEDEESLQNIRRPNPDVSFIRYEWSDSYPARYWHNYARIVGMKLIAEDIDWVLFLDADEIVNTQAFLGFAESGALDDYDSFDFLSYWYFRSAENRAIQTETQGTLVKKNLIAIDPHSDSEREQLWKGRFWKGANYNRLPIVHHYSWVRSKGEMLAKVTSWGHKNDRNWVDLVDKEFSKDFDGTDFVHGYQYTQVENLWKL